MRPFDERKHFTSRSIVSLPRLPILILGAFASALCMAWLLHLTFLCNFYMSVLGPALAALGLGFALRGLVGGAHCRNHWVAGAVGLISGLILYLGCYQLCFAAAAPPFAWRMELLPNYIQFRLQTDVVRKVGHGFVGKAGQNPPNNKDKPSFILNSFIFISELLIVEGIVCAAAWKRTRWAYCDDLGGWMSRDQVALPGGFAGDFCQALETGSLADFAARTPRGVNRQLSGLLIVEYAGDARRSALEYPVYLSVEDFPISARLGWLRRFRRTYVRQIELEPDEMLDLRPLFPKFARLLEDQHPEVRELAKKAPVVMPNELPADEVGQVSPVPKPFRKCVRRPGYALFVTLRSLIPLVHFLGGVSLAAVGYFFLALNDHLMLGCAVIAIGGGGVCWGSYVALGCQGVYADRWRLRRLRQEIEQRSDHWVSAQDPEAIYVSIIPRENFAKFKWTMDSDLLLARFDAEKHRLLMEGDSDRYRIPWAAVFACQPLCFYHPTDHQHRNQLWMVRLLVQMEQGQQELLLSVGQTDFRNRTNQRRLRAAQEFCVRVMSL
ncbi:MAG TPA: hypothetical protein VK395_18370 [Gemmataceae bacterium]|nr:hypothetical protein [Gemmataceae bacterium]